jgi:hypothetical protein
LSRRSQEQGRNPFFGFEFRCAISQRARTPKISRVRGTRRTADFSVAPLLDKLTPRNFVAFIQTYLELLACTLAAVVGNEIVSTGRMFHTLATEVLEMGGTVEEAADILGDSETIVRKHYAKWSRGRQARISGLLARIWHLEVQTNEWDELVDEMGFEPTTPALRTPCSPS